MKILKEKAGYLEVTGLVIISGGSAYRWMVSVRVVTPAAVSTLTMYTPMV